MRELSAPERAAMEAAQRAWREVRGPGMTPCFEAGYRAALAAREEPQGDARLTVARVIFESIYGQGSWEKEAIQDQWLGVADRVLDALGSGAEELPGDDQRLDANERAAFELLQRIAAGLPYTASAADLIGEAEGALAQLGLECPNCHHGRVLGVKWERQLDSDEPVPVEVEEPCETCGASGFVVRDTEREHEPADDAEHIVVGDSPVTLCGQSKSALNCVVLSRKVPGWGAGCWTCLTLAREAWETIGKPSHEQAEVLAKALADFISGDKTSSSVWRKLQELEQRVKPTLQALGYPRSEAA